ncbi:MAG: hypothetical protein Q9223_007230 [Gallowayella weberi]
MAILDDFEVRVISKSTGQPLQEYDNPDKTAVDHNTIDKFIEATTGKDFAVEVFAKMAYQNHGERGLVVGIIIDGGVVKFQRTFHKSTVTRTRKDGKPLTTIGSVLHLEGSKKSSIGFRFGSLIIVGQVEQQQQQLAPVVEPREQKGSNAMSVEPQVKFETTASKGNTAVPVTSTQSTGDDAIARRVKRLEKQLKESQEQLKASRESHDKTNTLMHSVMGGFSTILQAVAGQTPLAPAAFPAAQLPIVKRERVEEEDDKNTENSTRVRASSDTRPTKRYKTIIELD